MIDESRDCRAILTRHFSVFPNAEADSEAFVIVDVCFEVFGNLCRLVISC